MAHIIIDLKMSEDERTACSFQLISGISSHPAVFFSHNKPANSTFSHNKPAKRTGWKILLKKGEHIFGANLSYLVQL
jgi:hypothetical protein